MDESEKNSNELDAKLDRLSLTNEHIGKMFKLIEKGASEELAMKTVLAFLPDILEANESLNEKLTKMVELKEKENNIIRKENNIIRELNEKMLMFFDRTKRTCYGCPKIKEIYGQRIS